MQLSKDEIRLLVNMMNQVQVKGIETMDAVLKLASRMSKELDEDPAHMIFEDERSDDSTS